MNGAEGKADVQVTRPGPGITFPFGSATAPPHPHITQWCRFTVPERLPLRPFRQDRLPRLPLPPSVMATSSKGTTPSPSTPNVSQGKNINLDIDPLLKIQQLEKNLAFVQESHAFLLRGLHEEVEELKQKNRELQFQLVTGMPALPKQDTDESKDNKDIPSEVKEKMDKLEKEVKKLRNALKEALKTNTSLTNQLQMIKRDHYMASSTARGYSRTPPDSAIDDGHRTHTPSGPSPQMDEYSDTLRQIQRAAGHRSGKSSDSRHGDRINGDWGGGYLENRRGYHHHHHQHHHQQQQQQQQPRLPRLPLRNHQQNYPHHQYEIQYRQRSSNALPALKQPLIPLVEHRGDKQRKSRGPQRAKILDHVSNH